REDLEAYGQILQPYLRNALLAFWVPADGQRPLEGDRPDERDQTRLIAACDLGDEELALAYLGAGADPELSTSRSRFTPLYVAAMNGALLVMQRLLDLHAALAATPALGATALHGAALRGHSAACELLLAHGADPAAATTNGITVLHAAAGNGH